MKDLVRIREMAEWKLEPVVWRYRLFRETDKWTYEPRKREVDCRRNANYEVQALGVIPETPSLALEDPGINAMREAMEALKLFAAIADEYADQEDDNFQVWADFDVLGATLPLRNFRRAREAYRKLAAISALENGPASLADATNNPNPITPAKQGGEERG